MSRSFDLVASVAIGGAIGSVARYLLTATISGRLNTTFPVGTLVVNLIGCLVIGALMQWVLNAPVPPATRALLTTGLCGGFTTFSTFAWETVAAIEEGEFARAAIYVGTSVIVGLVFVWIGREGAALLMTSLRASVA